MINCNLNQFETMSMCTGCTDWKMQIPSALNQCLLEWNIQRLKIVSTVHRVDSLAHMLIVFDSKSSLTHYTFDKIKFLSQLHICIIQVCSRSHLAFALLVEFEITLKKILASLHYFYVNFISKEHFSNWNILLV
jgi:hypothetical protein